MPPPATSENDAEVIYPAPFVIALLFKEIFADPSKETPAIVLAVASFVAVAAFPVMLSDVLARLVPPTVGTELKLTVFEL